MFQGIKAQFRGLEASPKPGIDSCGVVAERGGQGGVARPQAASAGSQEHSRLPGHL